MVLIVNFLLQMAYTVGIIFIFGFIIAVCNKIFYKNLGMFGLKACCLTGFIGTPVHECSHALFCLIFGHKIHEIKLFQISSEDGTLGYVSHSYNHKNLYQRIGNFFIGIAPIICISLVLYLLEYLLIPETFIKIKAVANREVNGFDGLFQNFLDILLTFFSGAKNPWWWLYLIVGMFLALHMNLSDADIKGALGGLILFVLVVFVIDLVLFIIGESVLLSFTATVIKLGGQLASLFTVSLSLSILSVIISFLIKVVFKKRI